jgi:hypothetical protein
MQGISFIAPPKNDRFIAQNACIRRDIPWLMAQDSDTRDDVKTSHLIGRIYQQRVACLGVTIPPLSHRLQ